MIWKSGGFKLLTREGPCHVSGPSLTSLPSTALPCSFSPERVHLLRKLSLQRYPWSLQIPFCLSWKVISPERPALTSTYKRTAFLSTPLSLFSPLIFLPVPFSKFAHWTASVHSGTSSVGASVLCCLVPGDNLNAYKILGHVDKAYGHYFWLDDVDIWIYQRHLQSPRHRTVPFSATLKIGPHDCQVGGSEDPLTYGPHALWFSERLLSQCDGLDSPFSLKKSFQKLNPQF